MSQAVATTCVLFAFLISTPNRCSAVFEDDRVNADETQKARSITGKLPNLPTPTLGGKQFWTDRTWNQGWKVQQNALTKHFRLLDPKRVRRAWGSRESCEQAMRKYATPSNLRQAEEPTKVYVLIHGLIRSCDSMSPLADAIKEHSPEATVITFEYASTRGNVGTHAAALSEIVECLPPNSELHFVGHSLGNIIVRYLLGEWERTNHQDALNRVKRVVMLGPPNQGSSIAKRLSKIGLFGAVTGRSGLELGPEWEEFELKLATPSCPFGIVAGRLDHKLAQNPLVDGVGDFVVSVDETKLPGASGFLEVPQLHSFLMSDKRVQQAVLDFMDNGKFSDGNELADHDLGSD